MSELVFRALSRVCGRGVPVLEGVLRLVPGKEIAGCLMTFLIPHVFLFFICSAGFFSVSFLGVSSDYTGR